MKALEEMCEKDRRYVKVVRTLTIVKNAVKMLGGKMGRRRRGKQEMRREDGEEGEGGEDKEERGSDEISCELRNRSKIQLLELLVEVVEGGMKIWEILDEEELMEVVLELEEEGNKHLGGGREEEGRGEGEEGEEKEEEKREWEELSERAHELVWVMETMKRDREMRGMKKRREIEWMESMKEEEIEKENDLMKKNSLEMERENYRLEGENGGMKEEMGRLKEDNIHLKELCPIFRSVDDIKLTFPGNGRVKGR